MSRRSERTSCRAGKNDDGNTVRTIFVPSNKTLPKFKDEPFFNEFVRRGGYVTINAAKHCTPPSTSDYDKLKCQKGYLLSAYSGIVRG